MAAPIQYHPFRRIMRRRFTSGMPLIPERLQRRQVARRQRFDPLDLL
jgi:hypothetical protein